MKKYFLIIVSIVLIFKINAQSIQWGPTSKINSYIQSIYTSMTGDYLGEIDGFEYMTYYDKLYENYNFRYSKLQFFEIKGNTLTNFSDFTKTSYDVIGVSGSNSNLCVSYFSYEQTTSTEIKVDFYNPKTFKLEASNLLLSFKEIGKNEPFVRHLQSENKEFNLFVVYGKDVDTDEKGLIVACFNKEYEEVWRNIYTPSEEWDGYIGDILVTNTGKAIVQFLEFEDPKTNSIKSFHFTTIFDQEISEMSKELQENIKIIDYKLGFYTNEKFLIVYTDATNIYASTIEFKNQTTSDILTQKTYTGNWKIDKIADLKNGKFTLAIQNRDVTTIAVKGNGATTYKYLCWNRSFMFIGINGDNDDVLFTKKTGRDYTHMQIWKPDALQILIEPFYFVKDGNLHVVYNTDRKTEESVCNSEENPTYFYYYVARTTPNPLTKMATITPDGKVTVKTLLDAKVEKGTCLSKFSHLDKDENLIIAKSKSKKLTFGVVK